jgi:hypothetical protein
MKNYESWWNSLTDEEKERVYYEIWVLPSLIKK